MEKRKNLRWGPGRVCYEGEPINVGGVNPWELEWIRCDDDPVELPHPMYRYQLHRMVIYKVETANLVVTFAAGELSANVWGFYENIA